MKIKKGKIPTKDFVKQIVEDFVLPQKHFKVFHTFDAKGDVQRLGPAFDIKDRWGTKILPLGPKVAQGVQGYL